MMNTDVCNGLTVPEVAPWTSSSSSSSSMTATCLDDGFRCKSGIHVLEQDRVRVARTSENIIADTSVTGTQCLCAADSIATQFYRFLARFSGRRRRRVNWQLLHIPLPHTWFWLALFISTLFPIADTCSSRATPKPRPPAPTPRPNITFHTYTCPPAYAAWYCLNGATCFTVKIENSLLYNCECANGYIGPRCEYKDLDGSYLPSQRRFMLETASIAGGATIAVFLVFIVCIATYIRVQKRAKTRTAMATSSNDCVDGHASNFSTNKRVFGNPWRDQIPKNVNILTMPLDNIPTVTMPVTDHSNQECATTQPDVHWTRHQITGSDRVQSCVPP